MTITLTPETETKLREKAQREGADVNSVAEALISAALELDERERQEACQGIKKGLEASAQGRVRPADDVFAELKAKLNINRG